MSSLKSTKDIDEIESEVKVNNHAVKTQLHELKEAIKTQTSAPPAESKL